MTSSTPRTATPLTTSVRPAGVPLPARIGRKAIGLGMRLFFAGSRLAYRLRPPFRMKLGFVDHVTLPCRDLAVAEEFYVGLLGARILMRFDRATLERWGRPPDEVEAGVHLSLVFASGARLDLFESPIGQPPRLAPHPHMAFWVASGALLPWKRRLNDRGVATYGPTQLGPPGQASLYFNDPFGNRLELVTLGYTGELPAGIPDLASLDYTWKRS